MKAIIFGAGGQDGIFLKKIFHQNNVDVTSLSRSVNGVIADISNFTNVCSIIKSEKPDFIIHLAANSSVTHEVIFDNHLAISTGTLNILEAAKEYSPLSKIFITGSGVQFKNDGGKISENTDFHGSSPYALARIHSTYAARYYRDIGLKVYIGYLFGHESPFRNTNSISQKIIQGAVNIKRGLQNEIEIGDMSVIKEWGYAEDIASGIYTLLNQEDLHEAVIGTGYGYSIKDWVNICFKLINRHWEDHIVANNQFKDQYKSLISDPKKINSIGWKASTSIETLAEIMMDFCEKN